MERQDVEMFATTKNRTRNMDGSSPQPTHESTIEAAATDAFASNETRCELVRLANDDEAPAAADATAVSAPISVELLL